MLHICITCVNAIQLIKCAHTKWHIAASETSTNSTMKFYALYAQSFPNKGTLAKWRMKKKTINNLNRRLIVEMLKNAARMLFHWNISFECKIFRPFSITMHKTNQKLYKTEKSTSFHRRINDKPIKIAKMVWHRINLGPVFFNCCLFRWKECKFLSVAVISEIFSFVLK